MKFEQFQNIPHNFKFRLNNSLFVHRMTMNHGSCWMKWLEMLKNFIKPLTSHIKSLVLCQVMLTHTFFLFLFFSPKKIDLVGNSFFSKLDRLDP